MNVGSTVVDERLQESITLRNNGGLGTNYRLIKTSTLRSEQMKKEKEAMQKEEVQSEAPREAMEKETSSVSGSNEFGETSRLIHSLLDLVNKEVLEVFTIKTAENGFLGPHASLSFPIEFTSPIAGTFHEEYTIQFDQTHPEVQTFELLD